MARSAGPSGGMLKRIFNPENFKKKEKSAMGIAKQGGNNPQKQTAGRFGGKK